MKYRVSLETSAAVSCFVEVDAVNEREATTKALEKVKERNEVWDFDGTDFANVDAVGVEALLGPPSEVCQGCEKAWAVEQLLPINDLHDRVAAGEIFPSGECPDCGSVCHPESSTVAVPAKVWILKIIDTYGITTSVHRSRQGALDSLETYAASNCLFSNLNFKSPEGQDDRISEFFESARAGTAYSLDESPLGN